MKKEGWDLLKQQEGNESKVWEMHWQDSWGWSGGLGGMCESSWR